MAATGRLVVRLCLATVLAVTGDLATGVPANAQTPAAEPTSVDVSKLPLDMGRIRRRLVTSTTTEERDGLNLRYAVTVFGEAPRIKLFTPDDNLVFGRAPYGAPSHADLMQMITPKPFQAPAANFGAALRWFADKARDK